MERLSHSTAVNWYWIAGLVLLLALSRLVPHPPNFTPVGAMAIVAGATIKDLRFGILLPVAAMLISDALIGFHSSILFVYAALVIMAVLSRLLLQKYSILKLITAALIASVVFFLITNFGAWLSHEMYPRSINGLWQAYIAGIPFFRNSLLGNLFFTAISFYALTLVSKAKVVHA